MCQPGRPRPHGLSQPGWSGVRRLPQHEIAGVFLVGSDFDPCAGDHVCPAAPRQRAVFRIGADPEQRMTLRRISVTGADQPLDQRDHLRDVLGGPRLDIRRQAAQGRHVLMELRGRSSRHLGDRLAARRGGGHDLVLDIGDVAHVCDVLRAVFVAQHAIEQVEHHDRAGVADMGVVVDRRAADIHPHIIRIDRREGLFAVGQRIVENEGHGGDEA